MHEHGSTGQHQHGTPSRRKPVVLIVAVVLMVAAMLMYVMSEDEALPPGTTQPSQPTPAAPA
jgi:hypothetical protein